MYMYVSLTNTQLHVAVIIIITNQFHAYSTGSDVTDHVPVDDNPAYMTTKGIHMNTNTAYDTVNYSETYEPVNISGPP